MLFCHIRGVRSSDLINWTADPNDTVTMEIIPAGEAQFFRFGID